MMDQICLSPEKLKILSGSDNLQEVKSLEMCVDTRQDILDNFGIYLPKLIQLKLNNSLISSVRDLGTSLSHLQVLWLARCGLTDLEGIHALSSLKELYVAYNSISDLGPVSILEHLELLDLEGNDVDDLDQLLYLGCCGKLRILSLEGNPVCTCPSPGVSEVLDYSYRSAVQKMLPQLSFLRPASAQPLDLRISSTSLSSCPGSARPFTSCNGSRPGSSCSEIAILNHEASDLTKGLGSVFCGNPLQAVRVQRQKIKLQNSHSQTRPSTRLSSYVPEHTYDNEESSSEDRSIVFAELRSWRIEHKHRLAIEEDQQPQVIRIHDSDDEYDDEGSHSHSFSSDDITKGRTVCRDTSSPDSSFQCPSAESPEMLRLTSSSDCSMSPSPPPNAAAPPAGRRIAQIHTRRLRPHCVDIRKPRPSEKTPGTDLRNLCPQSTLAVSSQTVSPQIFHKPHRPSASPAISLLRAQWSEDTGNHQCSNTQHKPIIFSNTSEKLTPRRPQTARAALQRLPDRNLLPARRNAHLE